MSHDVLNDLKQHIKRCAPEEIAQAMMLLIVAIDEGTGINQLVQRTGLSQEVVTTMAVGGKTGHRGDHRLWAEKPSYGGSADPDPPRPAILVTPDSEPEKAFTSPLASPCEPYREAIELVLSQVRNAETTATAVHVRTNLPRPRTPIKRHQPTRQH